MVDIAGYEGRYCITSDGKVINKITGRILKASLNERGYEHITLCIDSIKRECKIHRLVGLHFIPNPHNHPQINHIDGNKLNNNVDNLEWCTNQYNNKQAWATGLRTYDANHTNLHKPKKVKYESKVYNSIKELCEYLNVDRNEINRMKKRGEVYIY